MSDMERNKGVLRPTGIDTELFVEEDFENYSDNGFAVIDGEIYEVIWDVKRDTDCSGFADVEVDTEGEITFHTYHYNGGAHWTEVVERALR